MLTYNIMTEKEKYDICNWKYEDEYSIYNLMHYDLMKKNNLFLADINNKSRLLYSFYDNKNLVGFINLKDTETGIFLGIGVNPLYCNKGYGKEIINISSVIAKEKFNKNNLYLEIRTWNKRAICCYKKSGFEIIGTAFMQKTNIGYGEFFRMIKNLGENK